jgi:hypothetical protein
MGLRGLYGFVLWNMNSCRRGVPVLYLVFTFLPGERFLPHYLLFRVSFSSIKGIKTQLFAEAGCSLGKISRRKNGKMGSDGTGNALVDGKTGQNGNAQ